GSVSSRSSLCVWLRRLSARGHALAHAACHAVSVDVAWAPELQPAHRDERDLVRGRGGYVGNHHFDRECFGPGPGSVSSVQLAGMMRLCGPAVPALSLWTATAVLGERWVSDPRLARLLQ